MSNQEKDLDVIINEIKDAAKEVYDGLKAGYDESVYEEAMALEFRNRNLSYEVERNTEIFYKGEKVGLHRLDFIVENKLVVELKAATKISKSHIGQTKAYLKTLNLPKGLLINFPYPHDDIGPEMQGIENDHID